MLPITLKIVAADGRIRQAATAEGPVHLIYRAPYEPGDRLVLDAGAPGRHLVVQLEDTMPPALLYGAEAQLCFPVPFGDAAIVYSPKAFSGDCHVLRARAATAAEVAARRSLAFNPYDLHQPTGWYPHARANVETRGEAVFAARNAIDGVWENDGHGLWPWQSWGINRDPNAALTVEFGRPVRVEEIRLTLRADFPPRQLVDRRDGGVQRRQPRAPVPAQDRGAPDLCDLAPHRDPTDPLRAAKSRRRKPLPRPDPAGGLGHGKPGVSYASAAAFFLTHYSIHVAISDGMTL